ncbi:ATP-dependent RNA helicase DOB1 [Fusarium oxysporum f. sp. albedinis]|nr:ATP-dependent RNA helicase DOB1 [Fusarium oxysporum f. sp. albedinis]
MVHPPLLSLASAMLSMEYCNMSDSLEPRKSRVKRQTDVFDLSHDITVIFMVSLLAKLDNILPCQYWCIDRGNDWLIVMQLAARRGFTATRLG